MRKKLALSAITAVMVLSSSMTAFAEPELLEVNGETVLFDSEYYATNNADVAAIYGTDKNALALHYVTAGISEGRLPYAPGTDISAYQPVQEKKTLLKTEMYNTDDLLYKECFYDNQENLIREVEYAPYESRQSGWTDYVYDNVGNLIKETHSYGLETEYFYDSHGELIYKLASNSKGHYYYQYEYDSQGRKIKKTECYVSDRQPTPGPDAKIDGEVEYSYDSRGNLIKETRYQFHYTLGRQVSSIHEYTYNGNTVGMAMISYPKGKALTYTEKTYDSQGNLIREVSYMPPALVTETGEDVTYGQSSYTYDLVTKTLVPSAPGVVDLLLCGCLEYNYDSWGKLTRSTAMWGYGTMTDSTEYSYDSQGNRTLEINYSSTGEKKSYIKYIYE